MKKHDIEASGKIKDGKLLITYRKLFIEMIAQMPDCNVDILLTRRFKRRSTQENRYYWSVVVQMVFKGLIDLGYDLTNSEQAHEIIKELFFKTEIKNKDGEFLTYSTTTKSTTVEFEEKLSDIRAWALDYLGIKIPVPNEQVEMF